MAVQEDTQANDGDITPLRAGMPRVLVHARGMDRPEEPAFWERLRNDLVACGVELVVVSHNCPAIPMDVPWMQIPNGLDNPDWDGASVAEAAAQVNWPGWTTDALIEREDAWRPPVAGQAQRDQRLLGLSGARVFYATLLDRVRPWLTVIWNGEHAQERVLAGLCEVAGCPLAYIERSFVPGMIHVDAQGILGGSSLARRRNLVWEGDARRDTWEVVMDSIEAGYLAAERTWWEQPETRGEDAVRDELGIPDDRCIVLFAGQVDADAQNLLYSPLFANGLDAFRWFCSVVPEGCFIVGKHHPKSQVPVKAFADAVGARGIWTDSVSLSDALSVADRVVAVNSTVLYEALMHRKPTLMLGQALLSGKDICYEVVDRDDAYAVINDWRDGRDLKERLKRWQDFEAWALAHDFYAMTREIESMGTHGSRALAGRWASKLTDAHVNWDALPECPSHDLIERRGDAIGGVS